MILLVMNFLPLLRFDGRKEVWHQIDVTSFVEQFEIITQNGQIDPSRSYHQF